MIDGKIKLPKTPELSCFTPPCGKNRSILEPNPGVLNMAGGILINYPKPPGW
jgi:hypothetical protein